jgi:hypothetical protein
MIAAMATPEYAFDDASAAAVPGVATPRQPGIRPEPTPASTGGISSRKAVTLLLVMALAAAVLITVTVRVAARGLAVTTAAPPLPSGHLIVPAPAMAGSLPRRYRPPVNPVTVATIAQFRQRFTAATATQAGRYAAALYVEPGHADMVTDTAAWIMYIGVSSRSGFGAPAAASATLMASLAGPSSRTWPVPAGSGGGSARCGVTTIARTQASVCIWVTGQVAAALMAPVRDTGPTELAVLLPLLRASLQSS